MSGDVVYAGELVDQGAGELVLPGDGEHDWYAAWIVATAKTKASIRSYTLVGDMWQAYLDRSGLDLLDVQRVHFDAWIFALRTTPTGRTGRPPAPATLAQRTAAIASLYDYLVQVGAIDRSPVPRKGRDKAPAESTTIGMSQVEAIAFRTRCREYESVDDRGVLVTMLGTGVRVAEVSDFDVGDVGTEEGEVILLIREGKGRKARKVVAGAEVVEVIDAAVRKRADELGLDDPEQVPLDTPLFRTARGRYTQRTIARMVQRVARAAGVTSWASLSPHSLRHTYATLALDAGVPIDEVQDALGHAHTNTTRRYDRARGKVRRLANAAHRLDAYLTAA